MDPSVFTIHGNEAVQRYTAAWLAAGHGQPPKDVSDGVRQDNTDEPGVPDQDASGRKGSTHQGVPTG